MLAVGALGALVCARVVAAGEAELAESTRALRERDPDGAILHARRAAAWSLPRAPHVEKARERLRALARGAEEKKRPELALLAWRALRASDVEARSLLGIRSAWRDEAECEIARLAAAAERPPAERTLPAAEVERWHASVLSRETLPAPAWSLALVAAAGAWVVGALAAGTRAASARRDGGALAGMAGWGILLAAAAAVWVTALLRA